MWGSSLWWRGPNKRLQQFYGIWDWAWGWVSLRFLHLPSERGIWRRPLPKASGKDTKRWSLRAKNAVMWESTTHQGVLSPWLHLPPWNFFLEACQGKPFELSVIKPEKTHKGFQLALQVMFIHPKPTIICMYIKVSCFILKIWWEIIKIQVFFNFKGV